MTFNFELNKCTQNMTSAFDQTKTSLAFCSNSDARCGAVKIFINFAIKQIKKAHGNGVLKKYSANIEWQQ